MPKATITNKGQITIPKEVRKALALTAGHRVSFLVREDGVVEMRPETVDLMSLFGSIKPRVKGVSVEDMDDVVRRSGGRHGGRGGAQPPAAGAATRRRA